MITLPSGDGPISVTTQDGTIIRCTQIDLPLHPNSGRLSERRWLFVASNGRRHIGPLVQTAASAEAVTELAQRWWATRVSLRQWGSGRRQPTKPPVIPPMPPDPAA